MPSINEVSIKPLLSQDEEIKEKIEEVLVQPIGTGTIATTDTGNNQSLSFPKNEIISKK